MALALVTLLLALAGCGGGDGEGTSTSAQGGDSQATATTEGPTTSAGEEGGEDGDEYRGGEASIEEFGSEAGGSDREAIRAAFTAYLNALAEEDYATACSHLSAAIHESLEQLAGKALKAKGCAALLPGLLAPTAAQIADEQANGRVTKVRVEGDQAFVVFEAPGAALYQLTMVKEGGEWKAASLAASVLVPEL